jgi:hypothetical protein
MAIPPVTDGSDKTLPRAAAGTLRCRTVPLITKTLAERAGSRRMDGEGGVRLPSPTN